MVEFVIALPLLVIILFAALQFGIVFKDWLTVTDAAGTGARAAAVARFTGQTNCAAANAAVDPDASLTVTCQCEHADGSLSPPTDQCAPTDVSVKVTVQHPWDVNLPLVPSFGHQFGDLTSAVTENLE
jgi:Flp pilus assembly protein TadG